MTQEEKARAYDEAKLRMSAAYNSNRCTIGFMNEIFPELKESEDERIRKAIHIYLDWLDGRNKDYQPKGNYTIKDMIAWLEKQAEHAKFRDSIQVGDKVTRNQDGVLVNLSQLERVAKKDEKQGEHKLAGIHEPKFHKGDWIIFNGLTLYIKEVVKGFYRTISKGGIANSYDWDIDKVARLWTIQDAKDGDVLVDRYGNIGVFEKPFGNDWHSYCYLGCNGDFMYNDVGGSHDLVDTYPAIKEQRDILFAKMKEAGYVWDADKKELKKIEQKPAWSEEDEEALEVAIIALEDMYNEDEPNTTYGGYNLPFNKAAERLKSLKDRVQPKQEWKQEDEKYWSIVIAEFSKCAGKTVSKDEWMRCNDWLNSLRPQNRWKPSDKQIKALDDAIANCSERYCGTAHRLISLRQDLKKLMEE